MGAMKGTVDLGRGRVKRHWSYAECTPRTGDKLNLGRWLGSGQVRSGHVMSLVMTGHTLEEIKSLTVTVDAIVSAHESRIGASARSDTGNGPLSRAQSGPVPASRGQTTVP